MKRLGVCGALHAKVRLGFDDVGCYSLFSNGPGGLRENGADSDWLGIMLTRKKCDVAELFCNSVSDRSGVTFLVLP